MKLFIAVAARTDLVEIQLFGVKTWGREQADRYRDLIREPMKFWRGARCQAPRLMTLRRGCGGKLLAHMPSGFDWTASGWLCCGCCIRAGMRGGGWNEWAAAPPNCDF